MLRKPLRRVRSNQELRSPDLMLSTHRDSSDTTMKHCGCDLDESAMMALTFRWRQMRYVRSLFERRWFRFVAQLLPRTPYRQRNGRNCDMGDEHR